MTNLRETDLCLESLPDDGEPTRERRADPRYPTLAKVRLSWLDDEEQRDLWVDLVNISQGGAALVLPETLPESSVVRVEFSRQGLQGPVGAEVLGTVPTPGSGARVRLKFLERFSTSALRAVVQGGNHPHKCASYRPSAGMESLEGRELLTEGLIGPLLPLTAEIGAPSNDSSIPNSFGMADDDLLSAVLYGTPNRMASKIAPNGSVSLNSDFENGLSPKWYVELQRYGADFVQAGLVNGDIALLSEGWKILDWGFARQGADGGFSDSVDAFHGTSMFVEAASRALLLTAQSGAADAPERLAMYLPKIDAAANWLLDPARVNKVEVYQSQYAHRRWILAAGMGQTAALARHQATISDGEFWAARASAYEAEAARYAELGLAMQADGMQIEKGGGDVSYQAYGVLQAQRFLATCPSPSLAARVKAMTIRSLDWACNFIASDGTVSLVGSTRTGVEVSWSGVTKSIDYKTIVQCFSAQTTLTDDPGYRAVARAVAAGRGWIRL